MKISSPYHNSAAREIMLPALLAAGIALVVCWSYHTLLHAAFVYDDLWTIVRNPAIRSWSLRSFFADAQTVAMPGSGMAQDIYRPIATVLLSLEYHFWRLHPLGYHAVNLFLHLLNGLLFWRLACRLLPDSWSAWIAAAIFLIHPVQVETVAWITQCSTLLCALGCLAALNILLGDSPISWPLMFAGILSWMFGIFSKETAAVLPGIALLIDGMGRLPRISAPDLARRRFLYVSWAVLSIAYWIIRWRVVGQWSSASAMKPALWTQWALGVYAFPIYLGKLILPLYLRVSYDTPAWALGRFGLSAAVGVLFLALWGWCVWRRHFGAVALGWILLMLLPVLHIIPIVPFFAERFFYLPVMGLALGAAWLAGERMWRRMIVLFWMVVLVLFTHAAVPSWRTETALWAHAVAEQPSNAFAHLCYAEALSDPALAIAEYKQALACHPSRESRFNAANNLAWLLLQNHQAAEALFWAAKAEQLEPQSVPALYNLCSAALETGDRGRAVEAYERLKANPSAPTAMLESLARRMPPGFI